MKEIFESMKVKDLKKLVSVYRAHHNIKGYSKMKKHMLVDELSKRFIVVNNELFLKNNIAPVAEKNVKKRITPYLVSTSSPSFDYRPQSNAVKRTLLKASELENYYKNRGDVDQYPKLAF